MSVKPDVVTLVVRLQLLLAYWQDIYFSQLTEMDLIFSVFTNLIWTMTEILPKKKKKKKKTVLESTFPEQFGVQFHAYGFTNSLSQSARCIP